MGSENEIEIDITDEKNHDQVDDFEIDTLLDQKESFSFFESFTGPLFKTTIEMPDVPHTFFSKMSRSAFPF